MREKIAYFAFHHYNAAMLKTACLVCIILSSFPVLAVAPISGAIGEVATEVVPGSITETALEASAELYTEQWLEKYTASPYEFGEAYSDILSDLLPLQNPIAGRERNGAVDVQDLDTGTVLSFVFQDGRIAAILPVRQSEGT